MSLERLTNNVALVRVRADDLSDGAQCVIHAGGCLHIVKWNKTTQRFYVGGLKRDYPVNGVGRIWLYREAQ